MDTRKEKRDIMVTVAVTMAMTMATVLLIATLMYVFNP